jgi:hypothetical protein
MLHHTLRAATLALTATLSLTACAALPDEDGTDTVVEGIRDVRHTLSRVVIARMYQHGDWTIPNADHYRVADFANVLDRRVAYVCDTIARLQPTYVSGLVRIDSDETPTSEMITVFRRVKHCLRARSNDPVHFDIVLNAVHYADPHLVRSAQAGADLLRQRLRSADEAFHPDAFFFDFFTVPFNTDAQEWYPRAIRDGMAWIHHNGQKVGDNVVGRSVPPGTDFAVLTSRGGLDQVRDQAAGLPDNVPLLMHVRNDPHIDGTEGLAFVNGEHSYRVDTITAHASHQDDIRYSYMYPVFFPLDEHFRSYDAHADGDIVDRMASLMDRYAAHP